jgi:hypothetical protein
LKPDFQLKVPVNFTEEIYIKIINKIYAVERYQVYKEIRTKMREQFDQKPKYLHKQDLFNICKKIDFWKIRNDVFDLFGFGELNEPAHKTLMKAHLVFMASNPSFSQ